MAWTRNSLGALSMDVAIGTFFLVIAMKSFAGFAAHAQHVDVNYALAGMLSRPRLWRWIA